MLFGLADVRHFVTKKTQPRAARCGVYWEPAVRQAHRASVTGRGQTLALLPRTSDVSRGTRAWAL